MTPPPQLIATWPIVTDRDGLFRDNSPDGAPATILAVRDADSRIVDAVAWWPDTPGRWWLRDGEAVVLGSQALNVASCEGATIALHSTPARWLAAPSGPCIREPGRCEHECPTCELTRGVCVLRWDVPIRTLFDDVSAITCDCPALAQRLTRGLRSWEPRVTVARQETAYAA